jgi:hypothetical protein
LVLRRRRLPAILVKQVAQAGAERFEILAQPIDPGIGLSQFVRHLLAGSNQQDQRSEPGSLARFDTHALPFGPSRHEGEPNGFRASRCFGLALSGKPLHRNKAANEGGVMKVALALHRLGLRGSLMHSLGIGSILAAISLWGRSAAVSDKDRRARAERLAIFVGLWPPTFFLLGKVLQDIEATPDEQVSQARGAEATKKAKEAVPA